LGLLLVSGVVLEFDHGLSVEVITAVKIIVVVASVVRDSDVEIRFAGLSSQKIPTMYLSFLAIAFGDEGDARHILDQLLKLHEEHMQ